jgi:hypothetical protein
MVESRPDGRAVRTDQITLRALVVCLALEGALVGLDLLFRFTHLTSYSGFQSLFDVTSEHGLGNWFSSSQTLIVGLLGGALSWRARAEGASRWRVVGWAVVAACFVLMAIDDGAAIHERVGSYVDRLQARPGAGQSLLARLGEAHGSFSWQLVLGPVFGAMGLFLVVFLWRELAARAQRLLLVLAMGCLVMAVGLDYMEGTRLGFALVASALSAEVTAVAHLCQVLEELAEMVGTTLFLVIFLKQWVGTTD